MSTPTPTAERSPGPAGAAEARERPAAAGRPVTVIEPRRRLSLGLRELWEYRELLLFLTWRDVKVRYKQTALGALWAILQPFLLMVVFTIFLGRLAGVGSDGFPYPVFAFAALVPWTLFSQSLVGASNSLVGGGALVSKVYFPRLALPLASVGSYLLDFVIALAVLAAIMAYYGVAPGIALLALPLLAALAVLTALSVGIWLAALNVRYRDVRYAVPFLAQVWLFASPVAYSTSEVPEEWRTLYGLNPMTGVIEGFRWALLDGGVAPGLLTGLSVLVTALLLAGGLAYFRSVERTFADVI